jgi:hypothetical protein
MAARDRAQTEENGRHRVLRPNGEFIGIAEAVRTGAGYRIPNAPTASKDEPSLMSKSAHNIFGGQGRTSAHFHPLTVAYRSEQINCGILTPEASYTNHQI